METTNAIQQIYIGLLGRAADQEGLQYWTDEIEAGTLTLEQLRANIVEEQTEYEATFGGQTRAQVVSQLYANLFNRAPDSEGLQYWVNGEGASVNIDQLVLALVNGAAAADSLVLDNRTEVANYYTEELGAEGSFDADLAAAVIADVDGTRASVTQAKASVDNGDIAAPTPNEGNTFTLTANADTLSPNAAATTARTTDGNDLIRAVIDNSLQTIDAIDGGKGTDTLRANVSATGTDATAGAPGTAGTADTNSIQPLMSNVEKVFINATVTGGDGAAGPLAGGDATVNFNAADSTGIKELWSEGSTVTDGTTNTGAGGTAALNFTNVSLDTTVGVKDSAAATTFDFAGDSGAADSATLALADATGTVTIAGVETLNVNSAAGALGNVTTNDVDLVLAQTENLVVSGDQAADLNTGTNAANLESVDASGLTAAFTFTHTTSKDLSVTGGEGADTYNITDSDEVVTIDMGAGNDTLNILDTDYHVITTGAGNDTVNIDTTSGTGKGIDNSTAAKLAESVIEITDFESGSDVLNLDTANGTEASFTGTQLSSFAGASDLSAALAAAVAANNGADVSAFQYDIGNGTNTYVYSDATGNGISADDTLIQLTGVESVTAADIAVA